MPCGTAFLKGNSKHMKKHKLKITAAFALVLCFAVLFSACGSQGENEPVQVAPGYDYGRFKNDKITLNVYNWGEYISDGTDGESMAVNAEFEALTGIKINYTTFDTNEALYSKLKSGGANYDVIIPSDYMIGKMINEGMLASLDFENIPNYAMIGDTYKNLPYDAESIYSVPYTWGYVGIVYNTEMVNDPVDSWSILWDAKYKDNILMFDNSRDAFAIALKKLGFSLNPQSIEEIELAATELARQKEVVQAYVMDQIFDKMEGGEAALAPYYAGDAITMIEENPDLAFAVPKEGTNYFVDAMCIPAESRYKEAAEMYINFMCETEVAVENSLYIGYSTPQVQAEAAMPDEIRNNPIAYPDREVLANTEIFTVLPAQLNMAMDAAWSAMRGGSQDDNGWLVLLFLGGMVLATVLLSLRNRARKKKQQAYYR